MSTYYKDSVLFCHYAPALIPSQPFPPDPHSCPHLIMSIPDFDSLCDELSSQGQPPEVSPSELHGLACGILAAGFKPRPAQWMVEAADYTNLPLAEGDLPLLEQLYRSSQQQLSEGDFAFHPCLPDDDLYGLPERSSNLAQWCLGFLHGFAAVQKPLSEENQELLRDLTEISRLEMPAGDLDPEEEEESEGYYAELTEFVRMAAISLYMDHNAPDDPEQSPAHGHH